ncbi:MAG: TetR/AcrR family transcriptional regulator, partial [Candidatus Cryptobacteroides sp.]
HKESKREDVLNAADEIFMKKGLEGARTAEIAQKAGVTHAVLHYWFNTKEELFNIILHRKMKEFEESVLVFFDNTEGPLENRIGKIVGIHFDFIRSHPSLPRFIVNEICGNPDIIESVKDEMASGISKNLSGLGIPGAASLVSDIISLNLSAFLMAPVIAKLGLCSEDEYLDRRREDNISTILLKLKNSLI